LEYDTAILPGALLPNMIFAGFDVIESHHLAESLYNAWPLR
jgi:hypothetical protein